MGKKQKYIEMFGSFTEPFNCYKVKNVLQVDKWCPNRKLSCCRENARFTNLYIIYYVQYVHVHKKLHFTDLLLNLLPISYSDL